MRMQSELGAGTHVDLWLPACEADPLKSDEGAADASADSAAASLSILLVDDTESVRATTAALLEDLGHEVTEAAAAPAALEIIERTEIPFDLILTDLCHAAHVRRGTDRARPGKNAAGQCDHHHRLCRRDQDRRDRTGRAHPHQAVHARPVEAGHRNSGAQGASASRNRMLRFRSPDPAILGFLPLRYAASRSSLRINSSPAAAVFPAVADPARPYRARRARSPARHARVSRPAVRCPVSRVEDWGWMIGPVGSGLLAMVFPFVSPV